MKNQMTIPDEAVQAASPRAQALEEAAKIALDVSENGEYHGEASVDSTSSIYQQGAFEVYEAIRALSSQPVDQEAKDFEAIGRAFMSCFEVITTELTEWFGYTPAECPSELVMDIFAAQQELKSSQPVADGWQPIETAPKDGKEFLGYDASMKTTHVTFVNSNGYFHDPDSHYYSEAHEFKPTHWRPLPASPGASE